MLKINNLKVGYDESLVLKGVDLHCSEGEVLGVLGMNGAGKTTLFNALYNFIPKISGACTLQDHSIHQKDIAYLETHNFFYAWMNGKEYLELCSLNNPNFDPEEWNRIFQLPLKQLVDTYSTGMKKKLAFLGMLSLDRPVLVMDEPFNGVDFESSEVIYEILKRLKKQGKIVLLSSHIIESLTNICDRVVYLNEGLIEKTYGRNEFSQMELDLRDLIRSKMKETLDELF